MYLQIENLAQCETRADLQTALEDLPPTLEATYLRCLTRRKGNKLVCWPKVLQWASAAREPLTVYHLCEMLAIDAHTGEYCSEHKPSAGAVIRSGVSLLSVERIGKLIVPIHHSARRFIFSDVMEQQLIELGILCTPYLRGEEAAVIDIAHVSLLHIKARTELQMQKIQEVPLPPIQGLVSRSIRTILPMYKHKSQMTWKVPSRSATATTEETEFLQYAIRTWPLHTQRLTRQALCWLLFEELALRTDKTWSLHPWSSQEFSSTTISHLRSLLGYAVSHNHPALLSVVLERRSRLPNTILDCVLPGNDLLPALHLAAAAGFTEIIEQLLLARCSVQKGCPRYDRTAVHYAALYGRHDAMRVLCQGFQGDFALLLDRDDYLGCTPFFLAVDAGEARMVQLLLEESSPGIDMPNSASERPLFKAAERGYVEIVELLLYSADVDLNSRNTEHGQTPLWRAAEHGHAQVVERLLNTQNVDATLRDSQYGRAPLHVAAANGHAKVVELLLTDGRLSTEATDDHDHWTPLISAADNGHGKVAKVLLDLGQANPNSQEPVRGETPLHRAAARGHVQIMKLLLQTGRVDANAQSKSTGKSALSCAADCGRTEVVEFLLKSCHVDADPRDSNGQSPLSLAARMGHVAIVELLIASGEVDVDSKTKSSLETPLQRAVCGGHKAIVGLLLNTGKVDVNWKASNGFAALTLSADPSHEAVMELLLATEGIDVNVQDRWGHTALYLAAEYGGKAQVKLLLESGKVDVNVRGEDGQTPLFIAVQNERTSIVEMLLAVEGVDVHARTPDGLTAMTNARHYQYEKIVQLLQDKGADGDFG